MADLQPGSWRWRGAVGEAMLALIAARLMVALVKFRWWRHWLGPVTDCTNCDGPAPAKSLALAAALERADMRLPFHNKCLIRAIALHWMLRRRGFGAVLVIAALRPAARGADDPLHAWVEQGKRILIGEIGLPYQPIIRFGG